jgi:hypothetical protein
MHQRKKEKEELTQWAGDKLTDPDNTLPNFPDWDNPEDFDDDAPAGYYDDEDEESDEGEDDDSYVPDEDDPDYDLTEAAGYAGYDSEGSASPVPSWMITAFAVIVILGIVLGTFAALTR